MAFIFDVSKNKLDKLNINIKTEYIVGTQILERNSDNSKNDDIKNGIRCRKEYYVNGELKHIESEFDSRMEYTFISKEEENKDYTCPNCGMHSKLKDFIDGCPYCGTYYNMDYTDKDLGSKFHYDSILRSNLYRIVTAIIDVSISILLCFVFIKMTSRTFNSYDISKIFIYGVILSFILYYFFYIIDAYIILSPIKKYKNRQNQKQIEFWKTAKVDKKTFYNNLNYEVSKYYDGIPNIIDYDILDYLSFSEQIIDGERYIKVLADVRIVTYDKKISSKYKKEIYILKKNLNDSLQLNAGANIMKCCNCGASIDVRKGQCEYCGTKIKYLQEWFLDKNH